MTAGDERHWIEQRAAEIAATREADPLLLRSRWMTADELDGYEAPLRGCFGSSEMDWTREHEAGYLARIVLETI